MMVKKILCIVLSLAAVCSLLLMRDSVAWFKTASSQPVDGALTLGTLDFSFNGTLESYLYNGDTGSAKYIVTDRNLITDNEGKISLVNRSTIKTDVRCRVVYDQPGANGTAVSTNYTASVSDALTVTAANGWTGPDANGFYTKSYNASTAGNTTPDAVFTYIAFDDEKVTDRSLYLPSTGPFSGDIRVEFQAKQQDYVTWLDIGEIQISST